MTELKPYLDYLKINLKTYLLVVTGTMALILAIAFVINVSYLNNVSGSVAKASTMSLSSMYGSISGVAMVYGILLTMVEFNAMMNMRADRKSIMISTILSLIEFTILSMILFAILLKGSELLLTAISPVPLVFKRLNIMEYIALIVVQSSVGLALGALFYRFGGLKMTVALIIFASIVIFFGVSPSTFIQELGIKIILYSEIALENYEIRLTIGTTLLMHTIYWMTMRKAPVKEYARKKLFRREK